MIARALEIAIIRREQSDLGGVVRFSGQPDEVPDIPCAMGMDASGIQRSDNSAGFQLNQTRRIVVRTALLAALLAAPAAGDTVRVKGNLEEDWTELVISPGNGIESMNAILTGFNLYNPTA